MSETVELVDRKELDAARQQLKDQKLITEVLGQDVRNLRRVLLDTTEVPPFSAELSGCQRELDDSDRIEITFREGKVVAQDGVELIERSLLNNLDDAIMRIQLEVEAAGKERDEAYRQLAEMTAEEQRQRDMGHTEHEAGDEARAQLAEQTTDHEEWKAAVLNALDRATSIANVHIESIRTLCQPALPCDKLHASDSQDTPNYPPPPESVTIGTDAG